jgi:hypothetical protein
MTKQPASPYRSSPMTKEAPGDATQDEGVRGHDLKKSRGLNRNAGRSPNEAGTDQKVEDAKKARHASTRREH